MSTSDSESSAAETEDQVTEHPLREPIVQQLKSIIDPELYIDIWTLGLIYTVDIEAEVAKIRMTFTSVACPAGPQLVDQVRQKVLAVEGIEDISVEVVFDPPWEPSEELKALMGMA